MSTIEVGALIAVAVAAVYTFRNAGWWRSARPRLPW
jgi:hypothetical protein